MKIGTCVSERGKIASGHLQVRHGGFSARLPIKIIEGTTTERVGFISAGMHGDELNGMKVVASFLDNVDPMSLQGTLIVVPVLNPIGLHHGERRVRHDNKDLNRCFGKPVTGFSTKLARTIYDEIVSRSQFGLDFHDSTYKNVLVPHVRIFKQGRLEVAKLAKYFGTEIVMRRSASTGMLAAVAIDRAKVPVLTIEIGGGMTLAPHYYSAGLTGIHNVLVHRGFLEGKVSLPERQFFLSERVGYRPKFGGILTIHRQLGDLVQRDDLVGDTYDPATGRVQELRAKNPAVLFSIKALSYITAKDDAFSMLHFKRAGKEILPTEGEMVINQKSLSTIITTTGVFNSAMQEMRRHSKGFFAALMKE